MYKVSLGQYLGQNFMNRSFHNASLIFFATVSRGVLKLTYDNQNIEKGTLQIDLFGNIPFLRAMFQLLHAVAVYKSVLV